MVGVGVDFVFQLEGEGRNPHLASSSRNGPKCLNFGDCLVGVWRVFGNCLEGVWKVTVGCLEGVWRVSRGCLEGIYGMSESYGGCLDVQEGQVWIGEVRTGQVRTVQFRTGHVSICQVRTGQDQVRTG